MSTNAMIDWFLVDRYVNGQATSAERAEVEHWASAHPDHRDLLARIQAALEARRHREGRDWNRAAAIEAVMASVRAGSSKPATAPAVPSRRLRESGPTADRLRQLVRQWFEGATELAAAMLLDANDEPLTTDEVASLRKRIDHAKRRTDESE